MPKKKPGKNKEKHAAYKNGNHYQKNREMKLKRHVRNHPEDEQAKTVLGKFEKEGFPYRRKKPKKKNHSSSQPMFMVEPPKQEIHPVLEKAMRQPRNNRGSVILSHMNKNQGQYITIN